MIFKILITGLVFFSVFRIINVAEKTLPFSGKTKFHIRYISPLLEFLAWIGYLIWITRLIYESESFLVLISFGILSVLFAVPVFLLLRDFISGVILKLQNKVIEGSKIEIGDISGRVKNAGHFMIDIEDRQGNIRSLAYNSIRSKIITRLGNNPDLVKIYLEFSFPGNSKISEITEKLINLLISSPWTAVSVLPVAESINTENERIIIKVGVYTLSESFAGNIKEMVDSYIPENYSTALMEATALPGNPSPDQQ